MSAHEPPNEWMRADRRATRKALKRYGLLNSVIVAGILFVAAGMPGHFLWRWIGIPLIVLFACAFTPLLFHFGRFLWDLIESRRN